MAAHLVEWPNYGMGVVLSKLFNEMQLITYEQQVIQLFSY